MKKKIGVLLSSAVLASMLVGCVGTPVVYHDCNCDKCSTHATAPQDSDTVDKDETNTDAVKTGLSVMVVMNESANADAENAGTAKYDVTVAAVSVDDAGVIVDCKIDSIPATLNFDAAGAITSDVSAEILTKNELGENYGMKLYGGAKYEWNEQAAALAEYAKGKTIEELKNGAVGEDGKAVDADLASTATIYLGGYVSAIEEAVNQAQHLGAKKGDELRLGIASSLGSSKAADSENEGLAQLDADFVVMTMNEGVITSCYIDSVQAKVGFDAAGAITTDLTADVLTKNELGENYGMKMYAGSAYEWNEQAAALAQYVTGKTVEDVTGIAVNEKTAPTDADLSSTVTIAIGGYQALIAETGK